MSRRAVAWLLGLVLLGCGSGGSAKPVHKTPQADFLIGAGLVQGWPAHPREIVDANADAGLTLTEVEWVSDQTFAPCPPGAPRPTDFFGTDPGAYAEVVDEGRQRQVTIFVNIANANNCAVMAQDDTWFLDQLGQIQAVGLDGVLVSPVSEPGASPSKAAHWLVLTRERVAPDHLVDIPINGAPAAAFTDVHFCDSERLLAALQRDEPAIIHSTDCGTILDPGPAVASTFAKAAKSTHSPLMIYDNRSRDLTSLTLTIEAMGQAIK
jgi:hypothetical protein